MLDARKLARVVGNRARMRAGRTRTVTLVYGRPEGTAYVAVDVVWRAQGYVEPATAGKPDGQSAAVRAEFPVELDPRLVLYVADTPAATPDAVAAAPHYEVLSYRPAGLATNRWAVQLKRMR